MIQRILSTATAAFSPGSRFPPVCSRKRMSTGAPSASPQRRRVLRPVQAERSQRRRPRERKKLARLRKSVPRPKQNPRGRSKRPRARRRARKVRRKRRPVDRQRVRSRKGDAQIVCQLSSGISSNPAQLRHDRRLWPRSGADFVEQLTDKTERVNLIVVPAGREIVATRSRNDSGVVNLTEAFKEIAPSLPAHLADAPALHLFRHAERWLQRGGNELWLDPQPV